MSDTADTITLTRITDIHAALVIAEQTASRVMIDSSTGAMTPEDAAEILTETIRNLASYIA